VFFLKRRSSAPSGYQRPSLDRIKSAWWYYTVQVEDGSIVKGMYPDNYAYPPRMMQRRADLKNMDCLDVGSAEGLLPILAKKSGARNVVATDYTSGEHWKFEYLQDLHNAPVTFHEIGRAQNVSGLSSRYPEGFDYINISGVLYHVTSPIDTLLAARRLLKPNGLMMVSTIYLSSPDYVMSFNAMGRYQKHENVFWYLSLGFLDYMLRMACLQPVDAIYFGEKEMGYVSVLCRATDAMVARGEDALMARALEHSVEFSELKRDLARERPRSGIRTRLDREDPIDLFKKLPDNAAFDPKQSNETRLFLLDDLD